MGDGASSRSDPLANSSATDQKTPPVDWELFFEHARVGLIRLILTAETASDLRVGTVLIIRMLYNRKSDGDEIVRLISRLSNAIPDDLAAEGMDAAKELVVTTFRAIKETRKAKVEALRT